MIKVTVKEQLFKNRSCRNIILVNNNGDEIVLPEDVRRQLSEFVYGFKVLSVGQIIKYEELDFGIIKLSLNE